MKMLKLKLLTNYINYMNSYKNDCTTCKWINNDIHEIDCVLHKNPRFPYKTGTKSMNYFYEMLDYALTCDHYDYHNGTSIIDDPQTEEDNRLVKVYKIYKQL